MSTLRLLPGLPSQRICSRSREMTLSLNFLASKEVGRAVNSHLRLVGLVVGLALLVSPLVHAQSLEVKLLSVASPVGAGDDATISVQTSPGATCLITVRYKSGPSRARGLTTKTADGKGRVSWTWRVGSRTTPGTWPITITCSSSVQQGTLQTSFVVR